MANLDVFQWWDITGLSQSKHKLAYTIALSFFDFL